MENLDTLNTIIKFLPDYGGDIPSSGMSNAATAASAATTGDLNFIWLALFVLICAAFVICAIFYYQRKVSARITFISGAHIRSENKGNKTTLALPIITAITCLLSLVLLVIGFGGSRAFANGDGALTGADQIVGKVNVYSGNTVFSDTTISNTSWNKTSIQHFALEAPKDSELSDVVWKITIGDTVVYNNRIGEMGVFSPFTIPPNSNVIMRVEATNLTPELAKSLINTNVATCSTGYSEIYSYYNGTVMHPNEDGSADIGLDGATVCFMDGSSEIDSAVTSEGGKYSFTKAHVGMDGKIVVTKTATSSDADDYGYSSDTIVVDKTKQSQEDAHIGKIQSLAVKVFQFDTTCTTKDLRSTYWCPAFANSTINVSKIKFYEGNSGSVGSLISPFSSTGYYTMKELVNSTGSTAEAKMKAKFFAICTAGSTLNCYQTTDASYNEAFGDSAIVPGGISAEQFIPSFSRAQKSETEEVDRLQDANGSTMTPHGVYWDETDKGQWAAKSLATSEPFPTVNGINYSEKDGVDGWYEIYGGYKGGIISYYSGVAWSVAASSDDGAFRWNSGFSCWYDSGGRTYTDSIVLSHVFKS